EGVDEAVPEVPDQEGACEGAERERRDGEAPGRVEGAPRCDAPDEVALEIEGVDDAVPEPRDVVAARPDHGVGDEERAAEVLDVERREAGGKVRVGEVPGEGRRVRVAREDVDPSRGEVRRVEVRVRADRAEGRALEARADDDREHLRRGAERPAPAEDRPVL